MAERKKLTDPSLDYLRKKLSTIDDLGQLILNTHLEIEMEMNKLIELGCFHPEQLDGARLTFFQKVCLVRSMCPRKDDTDIWELVLGLNKVRNDFAHGDTSETRSRKLQILKQKVLAACPVTKREFVRQGDEKDTIVYLAAICTYFMFGARWEMLGPDGIKGIEEERERIRLDNEMYDNELEDSQREQAEKEDRERQAAEADEYYGETYRDD
jgi:hypothetical protein